MRTAVLLLTLGLVASAYADNDRRLALAIASGRVRRIDRCMRRLIHREGRSFMEPTFVHPLGGAEAQVVVLYELLHRQIGVLAVDWDRCVPKAQTWPGTWTLGVVFRTREGRTDQVIERCYVVQGGVPGTINIFGWGPRVRKDRHHLKCRSSNGCEGFLEEQRERCAAWGR